MVKGIGNVNKYRCKSDVVRNIRRLKRRTNRHSADKYKLRRQKAIKEALKETNTTKNLVKQNRSNPNANLLVSNKKRRLLLRNKRIRERDRSKMEVNKVTNKKILPATGRKIGMDTSS